VLLSRPYAIVDTRHAPQNIHHHHHHQRRQVLSTLQILQSHHFSHRGPRQANLCNGTACGVTALSLCLQPAPTLTPDLTYLPAGENICHTSRSRRQSLLPASPASSMCPKAHKSRSSPHPHRQGLQGHPRPSRQAPSLQACPQASRTARTTRTRYTRARGGRGSRT
jgi:hypothetical protein